MTAPTSTDLLHLSRNLRAALDGGEGGPTLAQLATLADTLEELSERVAVMEGAAVPPRLRAEIAGVCSRRVAGAP